MKKLIVLLCLSLSGCAAYSACVKAQMGPTVKAVTLAQVEQQVAAILTTAASQAWVSVGLQALNDACSDTNCRALVSCAVTAWQESHPAAAPSAKAAAQAFLENRSTVECTRLASR